MNLKNLFKNRDIVLLGVILLFTSIALIRTFNSKSESFSGEITHISCTKAYKSETRNVFSIKLINSNMFSNKLEIPCNVINGLSLGDHVTIDVVDGWLQQIKHNSGLIFDFKVTERHREDGIAFIIIFFFMSLGGLIFKVYDRMNNLKKHDLYWK